MLTNLIRISKKNYYSSYFSDNFNNMRKTWEGINNLLNRKRNKRKSINTLKHLSNGNRTEWSPIRSVIIRVINKIGRPRSGSPICLITSMITDRIGRHEVLLLINHNFNKICDIIGYFLHQNTRNSTFCFASIEKKKAI